MIGTTDEMNPLDRLKQWLKHVNHLLAVKLKGSPLHPMYHNDKGEYLAMLDASKYAKGLLVDLGCGNRPYYEVFRNVDKYIGIDVLPYAKPDIYGTCLDIPLRDKCADTVLLIQVLSLIPETSHLVEEIRRILKPGGCLVLVCTQNYPTVIFGKKAPLFDYYRFTRHGLRYIAEKHDLEVALIKQLNGFWTTQGYIFNTYLSTDSIFHFPKPVQIFLRLSLTLIYFAINMITTFFEKLHFVGRYAGNNMLIAIKKQ